MTIITKEFDGELIQVETYFPDESHPDVLFVHHGSSRSTYSSGSEDVADQEGFAIFAPIFPSSSYGVDEYQLGGITDDRNRLQPDDEWTTRLSEPMVDWARDEVGGDPDVYLFGFSAGGQFLNRVAAYERPEGIARIVIGSPSTWVLPSLAEGAPYGFKGFGADAEARQALKEYLALPMTIYLGSEDDNPDDPDLSKSAAAMRQGENRLERGINAFEMGKEVAEANGWDFNWSLVIAEGVGHAGSAMLRAPEMIDALYPVRDDGPIDVANGTPYDLALTGTTIEETADVGAVIGRASAMDPDGDVIEFTVAGDARFAMSGSDLVVAAGADLAGTGDRQVSLTLSADDGKGGVASRQVSVTIRDSVEIPAPEPDAAEVFRFSGSIKKGTTKLRHVEELDFDAGDALIFSGYDKGTFGRYGTYAKVESLSELRALDQSSGEMKLSSTQKYDLIITIDQGQEAHKIVFHELTPDALF